MKTLFVGTTALVAAVLAPGINESRAQDGGQIGRISLQIANSSCAAVSPQTSAGLNPNPSDMNDNDLDDSEILAIQEGCTLRAIATDNAGNRVSGEQLTLLRGEAPAGTAIPFGYARTTDARGVAIWRFQPTANTDFIYQAISAGRNQSRVTSNPVEIQLCTGEGSVGFVEGAPTNDAGMGCQFLFDANNGDSGNGVDIEDNFDDINPLR